MIEPAGSPGGRNWRPCLNSCFGCLLRTFPPSNLHSHGCVLILAMNHPQRKKKTIKECTTAQAGESLVGISLTVGGKAALVCESQWLSLGQFTAKQVVHTFLNLPRIRPPKSLPCCLDNILPLCEVTRGLCLLITYYPLTASSLCPPPGGPLSPAASAADRQQPPHLFLRCATSRCAVGRHSPTRGNRTQW
jgi:hypothetical protein